MGREGTLRGLSGPCAGPSTARLLLAPLASPPPARRPDLAVEPWLTRRVAGAVLCEPRHFLEPQGTRSCILHTQGRNEAEEERTETGGFPLVPEDPIPVCPRGASWADGLGRTSHRELGCLAVPMEGSGLRAQGGP